MNVALCIIFPAQRRSHPHGCDAGRMNAAPEGVDAANVKLARSGRLWSMVRYADSRVLIQRCPENGGKVSWSMGSDGGGRGFGGHYLSVSGPSAKHPV